MTKSLSSVKAMEPLPSFHVGQDSEFILGMSQANKFKSLTNMADQLHSTLGSLSAECQEMAIPETAILTEFEHAKSQVTHWLTLSCTYTCLKILSSKAAKNNTMSLIPSLEQTLDFAASRSLGVHASIKERMLALCEQIKQANKPTRK